MMNRELITELIERYLEGDMSPVEKAAFEERLENDTSFKKEFDLHLQVVRSFTWQAERNSLKALMKDAHREIEGHAPIARSSSNGSRLSTRRVILLAASVSLLITAGSLSVFYLIQQNQVKSSQYATLNRKASGTPAPPLEEKAAPAAPADEVSAPASIATAFAITEDGWMLTNHHVVKGKKYVYIEKMADTLRRFVAEVVASDARLDIALIRVTDPSFVQLPKIPFVLADNDALIGQKVFTLGYPKDDIVYSEGPVSSLTGFQSDTLALQLSLPVNPGNSGAPVFSENGELVGIITGKNIEADAAAYGLKSSYLKSFLENCASFKSELPRRNQLKGRKITEQVSRLDAYVFMVKS